MRKLFLLFFVLLLAGCATAPARPPMPHAASPCAVHEASWECQIERYHNVNVQ